MFPIPLRFIFRFHEQVREFLEEFDARRRIEDEATLGGMLVTDYENSGDADYYERAERHAAASQGVSKPLTWKQVKENWMWCGGIVAVFAVLSLSSRKR